MTRADWIEMFRGFPEAEHNKLVLVLQNGTEISIDTVFRFEQNFLIVRGRVGGTVDEARGFFIPYQQMVYVRFEKILKLEELETMFAKRPESEISAPTTPTPTPSRAPTPLGLARPALPTPNDPAAASRLLLERIKAARTVSAAKGAGATSHE